VLAGEVLVNNHWVNSVLVLRGDGAGGFTNQGRFPANNARDGVGIGQLNDDTLSDIVAPGGGAVSFLFRQPVPPIANAGPDQNVIADTLGFATVALDGSGSSDPEGGTLTYVWSDGGGTIATGVGPTVTLHGFGLHTITVTVTSGNNATASDSVQIGLNVPTGGVAPQGPPGPEGDKGDKGDKADK